MIKMGSWKFISVKCDFALKEKGQVMLVPKFSKRFVFIGQNKCLIRSVFILSFLIWLLRQKPPTQLLAGYVKVSLPIPKAGLLQK